MLTKRAHVCIFSPTKIWRSTSRIQFCWLANNRNHHFAHYLFTWVRSTFKTINQVNERFISSLTGVLRQQMGHVVKYGGLVGGVNLAKQLLCHVTMTQITQTRSVDKMKLKLCAWLPKAKHCDSSLERHFSLMCTLMAHKKSLTCTHNNDQQRAVDSRCGFTAECTRHMQSACASSAHFCGTVLKLDSHNLYHLHFPLIALCFFSSFLSGLQPWWPCFWVVRLTALTLVLSLT